MTLFSCSAPRVDAANNTNNANAQTTRAQIENPQPADPNRELYTQLGLDGELPYEAFAAALDGYNHADQRQRDVLTLVDFTQSSGAKRLWVIDMDARRVLYHTYVAHGSGSGDEFATQFSNRNGSHQSSLGLYLTAEAYTGRRGYSMMLDGQEPGVNDNARSRGVIVHGAGYVSEAVVRSQGHVGRSWGCPALPTDLTRPIIDATKNGSVLYIYGKA